MKKKGLNMEQKRSLTGWAFLLPAALLIFVFCFYPMVQALILSFQKGTGSAVQPAGFANYVRILKDATFQQCLFNTIFYFVIQVPIMLILALILAQLLNSPNIKGKGIYRTMIFLPCATSLVSYSMIFKSLFANDGLVNRVLSTVGIPTVDWFQNAWAARWVIVIALVWRWTGYNTIIMIAGMAFTLVNNMVLYPSSDIPQSMLEWTLFFGLPIFSIIAFCLLCAIAGPSMHEKKFTLRYVKDTFAYFWFGLTWIPILFKAAFLAKDQGKWVKTEHTRGISLDDVKPKS